MNINHNIDVSLLDHLLDTLSTTVDLFEDSSEFELGYLMLDNPDSGAALTDTMHPYTMPFHYADVTNPETLPLSTAQAVPGNQSLNPGVEVDNSTSTTALALLTG